MKKFLIVISVILILAMVSVFAAGCKKKDPYIPEALDIEAGSRPDLASGITANELIVINAGLAVNATEAQKKAAVLTLFNAADRVQRAASIIMNISDGGGYAKTGAEGYMTVRGFYFRSGNTYYSQTAGEVTSANVGTLIPNATNVARNMLDQLGRTYSPDLETFHRAKAKDGKAAKKPNVSAYENFPYVSADFSGCSNEEFDLDEWKVESRILNNVGELSNFNFNVNAIKDAVVSYNDDDKFYRIDFALDTSNKDAAYDSVVNYARAGLREASTSEDLDYVKYVVSMEIWDNGYVRSFTTEENWVATLKVVGLPISGMSDSKNTTVYYWKWEEIKEIVEEFDAYEDVETAEEFLNLLKWFD